MAKTFITGDIVSADVSNSGEKRVAIASPMMLTTVDVEGVLQLSEKAKTIYDAFQSGCSVFVDTTGVTDNACVFICLSTAPIKRSKISKITKTKHFL